MFRPPITAPHDPQQRLAKVLMSPRIDKRVEDAVQIDDGLGCFAQKVVNFTTLARLAKEMQMNEYGVRSKTQKENKQDEENGHQ